jgi:hypothetical protein
MRRLQTLPLPPDRVEAKVTFQEEKRLQ